MLVRGFFLFFISILFFSYFLIGVLVARAIAPAFSVPIYDLLMSIKSLPYLAAAKMTLLVDRTATDLLEEDPKFLSIKSSYLDAYNLIMETAGRPTYEEIAVVDHDTHILVGSVTRRSLVKAIDNFALDALRRIDEDENVLQVSSPTAVKIDRFLYIYLFILLMFL